MKNKFCLKCETPKSIIHFAINKTTKDCYHPYCKKCINEYNTKYYLKNKQQLKKDSKEYYESNKTEILEKCKQYKEQNKEIINIKNKKYRINNKEKIFKRNRKYRRNNWDVLLIKKKIYNKKQYTNNINFKLKRQISSRIRMTLKRNSKSGSTLDLLDCTIKELKYHLESQFTEGMTWDNHGVHGWHIDHIKPCASFDLSKTEEQRKCFNYKNLQPLWALDNLKKSNKIIY